MASAATINALATANVIRAWGGGHQCVRMGLIRNRKDLIFMKQIQWAFDNSYGGLPETLFTRIGPTQVRAPKVVILNHALAADLGITLADGSDEEAARLFSGNSVPDGADPIAQAYAGHQFGHFNILGDGRAILLGEHVTPKGQRVDIQLKGSGRTPYSRGGDGRAALGPMLREYVISEAMHALGIPTTRSLAVVATGEPVYRQTLLPGAVLARVAASHLRVGTFEYAARRGARELTALVDYAVARHDPALQGSKDLPLSLLKAVIDRQADLIVEWMRVGFIHGVMNTDNMTISGETIDFGPCAFMDAYDPATVFSSIDHRGRYAFGNQMACAQWNLARFAETLLSLLPPDGARELAEEQIIGFGNEVRSRWLAMMGQKLGLFNVQPGDAAFIDDALRWMHRNGADYTNTFRTLISKDMPEGGNFGETTFRDWHGRWRARLSQQSEPIEAALTLMRGTNPAYIPRNHQVEAALAAAEDVGDITPLNKLLSVLSDPYVQRQGIEAYELPPPTSERVYQTFCGT